MLDTVWAGRRMEVGHWVIRATVRSHIRNALEHTVVVERGALRVAARAALSSAQHRMRSALCRGVGQVVT